MTEPMTRPEHYIYWNKYMTALENYHAHPSPIRLRRVRAALKDLIEIENQTVKELQPLQNGERN